MIIKNQILKGKILKHIQDAKNLSEKKSFFKYIQKDNNYKLDYNTKTIALKIIKPAKKNFIPIEEEFENLNEQKIKQISKNRSLKRINQQTCEFVKDLLKNHSKSFEITENSINIVQIINSKEWNILKENKDLKEAVFCCLNSLVEKKIPIKCFDTTEFKQYIIGQCMKKDNIESFTDEEKKQYGPIKDIEKYISHKKTSLLDKETILNSNFFKNIANNNNLMRMYMFLEPSKLLFLKK